MSNKIGIVTLFGNYNYGNRLQNYAVQEIIKEFGFSAETIVFIIDAKKELYRKLKRCWLGLKGAPETKRYKKFSKFNREMIPIRYVYAKNGIVNNRLRNQYYCFFVGSDQVWNPEIRQKERSIFFLSFARKNQRICISPSIGVSSIPSRFRDIYYNGLRGFNYLSCREEEGKKEIERISEMKCVRLIDPTMVLTAEKWKNFAKIKRLSIKNRYIFCLFLGIFNQKLKSNIEEYAQNNGLVFCDISSPKDDFYSIDPRQLVLLLDNAEMIFTDSFHITAFSINLNRPFWVFDRISSEVNLKINSRIKTLVSLFGLQDRYIKEFEFSIDEKCDFSYANKQLKIEREKFKKYIELCLKQVKREDDGK